MLAPALLAVALSMSRSAAQDPAPAPPLPVSLERIRAGLQRGHERTLLDQEPGRYRLEIVEQVPNFLPAIDFNGGPVPPGGLYAYEQRQRIATSSLGQPFITVDVMPLARVLAHAIQTAAHERQERAARHDVQRAIAEYCLEERTESAADLCEHPKNEHR